MDSRGDKYLKLGAVVICILVIVLAFYAKYSKRHINLPVGCDEFGYLHMAKAISHGRLFDSHTERPFDKELIPYLENSPFDYKDYAHMIAPHAYHLDAGKKKVINQYPPGTSLVLSLLPWDSRKILTPPLWAFLLAIFLITAFNLGAHRVTFLHINLLLIAAYVFYAVSPLKEHFSLVDSVGPTYGILFAAGYLLEARPDVSVLFLGLSSVFRITNALLFFPLFIIYLGKPGRVLSISNRVLGRAGKAVGLFLAGGFWLYLVYAWILLGNPLASTYSYVDRESSLANVVRNISFYLRVQNKWFWVHAVLLILIVLLSASRRSSKKWILAASAIAGFNYAFYIVHRVTIDYYPYASAIILFGLLVFMLERRFASPSVTKAISLVGVILVAVSIVFIVTKFPKLEARASFQKQVKEYERCFSGYDVIWAESRSGTIEYATGKPSFRYLWGTDPVRADVLRWLKSHHYRQAIWVSDIDAATQNQIEEFLKIIPAAYVVKMDSRFGQLIEID